MSIRLVNTHCGVTQESFPVSDCLHVCTTQKSIWLAEVTSDSYFSTKHQFYSNQHVSLCFLVLPYEANPHVIFLFVYL